MRGNIDPALLKNGSADVVYNAVKSIVEQGKESKRFILGVGCEVDIDTPEENMRAFVRAGRDFGSY